MSWLLLNWRGEKCDCWRFVDLLALLCGAAGRRDSRRIIIEDVGVSCSQRREIGQRATRSDSQVDSSALRIRPVLCVRNLTTVAD